MFGQDREKLRRIRLGLPLTRISNSMYVKSRIRGGRSTNVFATDSRRELAVVKDNNKPKFKLG